MTRHPTPDNTTRLCVTRHGETDWNRSGILQGWIDVPLNDTGREQAAELADRFADAGFSWICTSPLIRSLETAEIIARTLGLPPPIPHDGLRERHFGLIQGLPKHELSISHPDLHQDILRRNPARHFEQGESLDHFTDRVIGALRDIVRRHSGARILVITHGWTIDVITRHIKRLPRTALLDMKRKNGESFWIESVSGETFSEPDIGLNRASFGNR